MNGKIIRKVVVIVFIAILAFLLAKEFYNDPLLKGGPELLGVPLYIVIVFFILLYVVYRIAYFIIMKAPRKK